MLVFSGNRAFAVWLRLVGSAQTWLKRGGVMSAGLMSMASGQVSATVTQFTLAEGMSRRRNPSVKKTSRSTPALGELRASPPTVANAKGGALLQSPTSTAVRHPVSSTDPSPLAPLFTVEAVEVGTYNAVIRWPGDVRARGGVPP